MQQVPSGESVSESSSSAAGVVSNEVAPPRWRRIPRVQLLRNKSDQRVPLYFDQTVPVWPRREPVRGSSNQHSTNASPSSSRSPLAALHAAITPLQQGRGAKAARKFEGNSETVWFRGLNGVLKSSTAEAHACNVSEILRACGCGRAPVNSSPPGYPYALNSSRWSGIEQDLFTCTSVDPTVFVVPTTAEFISNKKSKHKSKSKD